MVTHDKASLQFFDGPRWREAASCDLRIRSKAVEKTGGFALSPIRAVDAMRGAHGNVGCRTNTERFSTVRLRISIRSRWHLSYLYSRASRPRLVFCEWLGWLQAHNADIRIVSGPRHKPSDRERAPNRIISTTMIGKYFAGYLCPFGSASSCLIE